MECRDVVVLHQGRPVLDGITLGLHAGESVGVIEAEDLSDSFLLRLFALIAPPASGDVYVRGLKVDFGRVRNLLALRKSVAYIPHTSALISNLTLRDNVTLFDRYHNNRKPDEAVHRAMPLLERFDLVPYLDYRPAEVEAQHRRKTVIVREFLKDCFLVVFEKLRRDLSVQDLKDLCDFLIEKKRDGTLTFLISEDDESLVRSICERRIEVSEGRILKDIATGSSETTEVRP
ncbi:MAG: hypothetical protein HY788_21095 [Deltaproteobacteria bacterium]|nr:hypothetical protein [Deltaproteobacteria bacterium]